MSTPAKTKAEAKGGGDSKEPKRGERGQVSKARSEKVQKASEKAEVKSGKAPPAETKGILKKGKKSRVGEGTKKKPERVKREKPRKKSAYEKLMQSMGFYVGNITLKDPRAIEAAQALDLGQHHLRKLRVKFDHIDIDGSGNIDYDEFFESVGEVRSPFTDKLFSLIDLDGSGTIEFDEYVRVMATYCMFTKDEILRFCFECFDVDKSGTIDEKEFVELCKCINNASPAFPGNFKRALQEFDVNEDGLIDYSEFLEIDRRYPLILFPAFRLQDVMQRNSLGEAGWLKVIENYQESKRIEEYKATHGGRAPPDPPMKMIGKMFLPCLYREKLHIKVGADMEARHRNEDF